jgi:MFS family permease
MLNRAHEPQMLVPEQRRHLFEILRRPLADKNFRRLLLSTCIWSAALNLSAPFYAVFMFKRLHLSLTTVVGFSVFAQVMNISFLAIWGQLVDRFGNKPVFYISGILYIVSLALWPFTALPEPHEMTFVYLTLIHFFLGIAIAGVVVSSMNIVYNLAPKEEAAAYLALNATLVSFASALAPIIGGFLAHTLERWAIHTSLTSTMPETGNIIIHILDIKGMEYLFILSIIFGIYALQRLAWVKEGKEIPTEHVYSEFIRETRRALRNLSTSTGIFYLLNIPALMAQRRRRKRR